jgi:hypothetical protein
MNLKKHFPFCLFLFTYFFLLTPSIAHAQNPIIGTITTPPQLRATSITDTGDLISIIIKLLVIIAGLFSLWQFLTAGLTFISSNGDKNKIAQSTNKLNMAIIGLVVIGASFLITAILSWVIYGKVDIFLNPELQTF